LCVGDIFVRDIFSERRENIGINDGSVCVLLSTYL
jgi:hypothetical protein